MVLVHTAEHATIAVGDTIHVESAYAHKPYAYDAVVESIASDEYGFYFGVTHWDPQAECYWQTSAGTTTHHVTKRAPVVATVGTKDVPVGLLAPGTLICRFGGRDDHYNYILRPVGSSRPGEVAIGTQFDAGIISADERVRVVAFV